MGDHTSNRRAFLPHEIPLAVALLVIVAVGFGSGSAYASSGQARKPRQPSSRQRDRSDEEEFPPTPEEIEARKRATARAQLVEQMRSKARAEVEAAAQSVTSADGPALAEALHVPLSSSSEAETEDLSASALRPVGDLDGDGVPEMVFRWSRPERFQTPAGELGGSLPGWVLFLFSWDSARWQVTELMVGDGICGLGTLDGFGPGPALVAVEGLSTLPYPVLFHYQNHAASTVWDSRSENSRYQSYAGGDLSFSTPAGGEPPAMVVSGRADPGVIRFPSYGSRGFDVATLYSWESGAFVPRKSEFAKNEDYTLYRFLAALHLHDFRAAFALIDPARFLADGDGTADGLKKKVTESWPELLVDNLFDVPESSAAGQFPFELNRDDVHYQYSPSFGNDGKFLLTGLVRREVK